MEPKIKVSKHMPDVFLQSRNALPKDRQKKHSQKLSQKPQKVQKVSQNEKQQQQKKISNQNQQNKKREQKEREKEGGKGKKNRNPFFNVREYLRLSKEMDDKMKEVRQQLDRDRFSQFSLENNLEANVHRQEFKQHKIKYEDCLTLSLIKKTQTGSLRKILHVPSLKVYYLRESRIDFSIDKSDLEQWIRKCNTPNQSLIPPQKIIQLYWNIPQGYYSIVYEYTDGVLLDIILQNTNISVLQFVQNLALTHLKSDICIFNSILIVRKNSQSDIKYLPVYQEIDDMLPQYRMFRELLKIGYVEENADVKKIERIMVARLGFLGLVTIFSGALVDQDIGNILFQSKDCCLFHQQMGNPGSLLKIYFDENIVYGSEKQIISDFLCKMLKFKPEQRASFSQLIKHKFFKTKFNQFSKMSQIIKVLETPGSSTSKSPSRDLANNKLKKIINSMSLILQGAQQKQKKDVDLSPTNPNLRYILSELGFSFNEIENKMHSGQFINMLRKAFDL